VPHCDRHQPRALELAERHAILAVPHSDRFAGLAPVRAMIGSAQAWYLAQRDAMAGIAAGGEIQQGPATKNLGRRRAAGIYGAIVTAAILDTAGGHVSTTALVISVVVTLLVYWLAEEYAEVLGEQIEGGRLPSRASVWGALAATWPMVTASYAPLLALVLAKLAEASDLTAANVGLVAAIVLLTVHGWLAGRAAQLRSWQLFAATSIAAGLGLAMIALKDFVLIHLH
jgi:hypothetical protein